MHSRQFINPAILVALLVTLSAISAIGGCACACPRCTPATCPGWQPYCGMQTPCHGFFPTCWRMWAPQCPPCPAPSLLLAEPLPVSGVAPILAPNEVSPSTRLPEVAPGNIPLPIREPETGNPQGALRSTPAWSDGPPAFKTAQLDNR